MPTATEPETDAPRPAGVAEGGDPSIPASYPPARYLVGVIVGVAGAVVIWVAAPYSDFVIGSSFIADSYLPVAALALLLLLVLAVNPLLRVTIPRAALDSRQLALALGVMLVACCLPAQGLLRMLPYSLARTSIQARGDLRIAEALNTTGIPRKGLFPDRIEFGGETPVADGFIVELAKGESIPWRAWLEPALRWLLFLVPCWLLMLGLALVVLPQWRRNERLPFPLLTIQQAMIEEPKRGRLFAEIFRSRAFRLAAGAVFVLHVLWGAEKYFPGSVPAVPLSWNLNRLFTEEPLVHLPWHLKVNRIYFIFVGAAFFMSTRVGFSVWFFVIVYALWVSLTRTYAPPFHGRAVTDHRFGAMMAMTVGIIWLGRAHWARVFRLLFRGADTDEDRRDRAGGAMLLAGACLMLLWLLWAGVQPVWALVFVAFGFMVSLVVTRIVAETGMPFVRMQFDYQLSFVKMSPVAWLRPATAWLMHVIVIIFPIGSRVSVAGMSTHAVGMDPGASPRDETRLSWILLGVLVLGFWVCGAAHLSANYRHSMTVDGSRQPLNAWGTWRLADANRDIVNWTKLDESRRQSLERARKATDPEARAEARAEAFEKASTPLATASHNRVFHTAFGAALAGLLQWACLLTPRWPIHPIGLVMVHSFYSCEAWASVFLGWLSKVILLKYGGARAYPLGRSIFIGLIVGEVFAAALWAIVPAVLVVLGRPYVIVQVLPY